MGWSFDQALTNHNDFETRTFHFQKFEQDLEKGDTDAAVQDYENIITDNKSGSGYYQEKLLNALNAAPETWAKSIDISVALLNNSGNGDGTQGDLSAPILDKDGNKITLDEYLNHPEDYSDCRAVFDSIAYHNAEKGKISYASDGSEIIGMDSGVTSQELVDALNKAFNGGDFKWKDDLAGLGLPLPIELEADGSISNFIKDGKSSYTDATGGQASKDAAAAIASILGAV
jgi:hypothetical protein